MVWKDLWDGKYEAHLCNRREAAAVLRWRSTTGAPGAFGKRIARQQGRADDACVLA